MVKIDLLRPLLVIGAREAAALSREYCAWRRQRHHWRRYGRFLELSGRFQRAVDAAGATLGGRSSGSPLTV